MSVKKNLWGLASLAFFGFAGWQAMDTLARTPAFNASLRVEGEAGGIRTRFNRMMYDRAQYYHRVALEWYLGSDADIILEGEPTQAELDAIEAETLRIRDMLHRSLRINPGDAVAWGRLANVEAELGNPDAALDAYEKTLVLAPRSTTLALERMGFLLPFIADPEAMDLALSRVSAESVRTDLEAIQLRPYMRLTIKQINESPALAAFLERSEAGS